MAREPGGGRLRRYDAATERYSLTPEQAMALAQEDSPVFLPGAFAILEAMWKAEPRIQENFRNGDGLPWTEQDPSLFEGTERFFRPGYLAHLEKEWIPALDGVERKLEAGREVADVGCGHGASTVLMAQAYPRSTFIGFDFHEGVDRDGARARRRGGRGRPRALRGGGRDRLPGRATTTSSPTSTACTTWPIRWARRRRARQALAPDGTWMIVEPFAGRLARRTT